jgi:hypothetical protein
MKGKYYMVQTEGVSSDSDSDSDEYEVGLMEWTKNKMIVLSLWFKKEKPNEIHGFDITKDNKIFNLLLQEKHLSLPSNHILPSSKDLKKKKWCKWHNTPSHHTNHCRVFKQQIQLMARRSWWRTLSRDILEEMEEWRQVDHGSSLIHILNIRCSISIDIKV